MTAIGRWGSRASDKAGARDAFNPSEFERPSKPSSTDEPKSKPFDPSDFERSSKSSSTEGWPYKRARDSAYAMDPLTSKGEEIKSAMEKEYGPKKGESVFYASANKGTIKGVHDSAVGRWGGRVK